jgi:hypothetical protein
VGASLLAIADFQAASFAEDETAIACRLAPTFVIRCIEYRALTQLQAL